MEKEATKNASVIFEKLLSTESLGRRERTWIVCIAKLRLYNYSKENCQLWLKHNERRSIFFFFLIILDSILIDNNFTKVMSRKTFCFIFFQIYLIYLFSRLGYYYYKKKKNYFTKQTTALNNNSTNTKNEYSSENRLPTCARNAATHKSWVAHKGGRLSFHLFYIIIILLLVFFYNKTNSSIGNYINNKHIFYCLIMNE